MEDEKTRSSLIEWARKMQHDRVKFQKQNICPSCHNIVDINEFRDVLSIEEFRISGLCQKCQDRVWKRKFH